MRTFFALVLLTTLVPRAEAQTVAEKSSVPDAPRLSVRPTAVDVLLTVQAVAHTADMISSVYALTLSRDAHEANPMLSGFTDRPVGLVVASSAIDVLQAYTISKLQRRHPKWARVWAAALVGVEVWATANNIHAAGELQRRMQR